MNKTLLKTVYATSIIVFLFANKINAAEENKFTVEETLKDIKPASFSCEVTPEAGVMDSIGTTVVEPDVSCLLSAEKLALMLDGKNNVVLVDTRISKNFANFSIPGAINLTASELRRINFLRQKTVVLIGNGKIEKSQYVSCAKLKKEGFQNVRVLRGGMLSWVTNHFPLNGKANQHQMGVLTSLELWAESKFPENIIAIDASQKIFKKELINGHVMDAITAHHLKKMIKETRKQQKKTLVSSVVIVASEGADNKSLSKLREEMFPVPVLIYTDTHKKYKAQMKLHQAVMLAKQQGPKKPACHL